MIQIVGEHEFVVEAYNVRTLREQTTPTELARPVPSLREITSWIMRPRGKLSRRDIDRLDRVRLACRYPPRPSCSANSEVSHTTRRPASARHVIFVRADLRER